MGEAGVRLSPGVMSQRDVTCSQQVNGYARRQACGITCAANSLTCPGRVVWMVGVALVLQYRGDLRYIVYACAVSIFGIPPFIELM